MRNIEIKARLVDLPTARACAINLCGCGPAAELEHIDTYFNCPTGRLKLREVFDSRIHSELILYRRPDVQGPKASDYEISVVNEPNTMKSLLAKALGILVIVRKERTLFMYRNVRIHLDQVDGLGSFIEFEAIMPNRAPDSEGEALLEFLMREFGIADGDLLEGSYSDMLRI